MSQATSVESSCRSIKIANRIMRFRKYHNHGRLHQLSTMIILCLIMSFGLIHVAFAYQTSSQSTKKVFESEISQAYDRAHALYDGKKKPYIEYNRKINEICPVSVSDNYASLYYFAKSFGETFFQKNLEKLLTIRDFLYNCQSGSIIELPSTDESSISLLCNFNHSVVYIKNSTEPLVLCERK
jgi:hypothetical protein